MTPRSSCQKARRVLESLLWVYLNLHSDSIVSYVCFLDSNEDLPERWFDITLDQFRPPEDATPASNAMSSDCLTSDGATSDGGASNSGLEIDLQSVQASLLSDTPDPITDMTSVPTERVLVFTTVKLLALLALCKRGAVDGTFSVKIVN